MSISFPTGCPICQSSDLISIFSLADVQVHIGILWSSPNQAVAAPKGDIDLVGCLNCGHVFNRAFASDQMGYDQPYDNSLFFSMTFQNYARELCQRLVKNYDLKNKGVLEIGSGQGDFLRLLCGVSGGSGIGYDPATLPEATSQTESGRVKFVQDYYTDDENDQEFDLICSRHVLEHVAQPEKMIQTIAKTAARSRNSVVYIEVPNFAYTLRETAVWDLIYEHCQYFSADSLRYLMEKQGFKTLALYESFNGQYLSGEFSLQRESAMPMRTSPEPAVWADFSRQAQEKISRWQKLMQNQIPTAVWGAGAKGVSFLTLISERNSIVCVVDINPRKQGMFLPGTGHPVVSPQQLRQYDPQKILLMNPIYKTEVEQAVKELGLDVVVSAV